MSKEALKRIANILSGLDVTDATDIEMKIFKVLQEENVAKIEEIVDGDFSYEVFEVINL